ncbi:aldo/keto reductase [Pseudoxanthomonas suwonensis]|uniref:Aldo/keto reductase n=2 Tax=Pseudoxanthomonas suwonensis TaxID=314722 RepID=A0A0E3Z5V4_9GAMM|nr:aldo/keto reductase [Pseudoxanthomonas suwonensis]
MAGPGRVFAAPAPGAMLTRPIPSSGELLPVIGAGTSGSYDVDIGSPEYAQLQEVVKIFFEGGARVIDTAPNYGRSDTVVGSLLEDGGWRDKAFIATKIAADSRQAAEAQWAESLRRLRTDKVELLQVHNLRDWQRQLPYARELKAQGKTKYVGVTHYVDAGLPELERILRSEPLDFIQIHYSVNSTRAADTVLPLAQDKGVAVLINRVFDDGKLFAKVKDVPLPAWAGEVGVTSWAQMFLKFAISHPAVTAVIPATGKPERQRDQLKAGSGPLLSAAQQQELVRQFSA